jgi:protein-disulfide isomerase
MASEKSRPNLKKHQPDRFNSRRLWVIGGIVLILLVVTGLLLWPRAKNQPVSPARLAEDPSLGPADAPVTVVEYGDFGCTTCRAWFFSGVQDQVLAKYGDQVRFVWRDFPIITTQSPKAAEAGQCAYDQGKFWEYHDTLYQNAPALGVGDLKRYAADLGLDTVEFNQCLDSGRYQELVQHSEQQAYSLGFQATPDFLVNDQKIIGPPTFEQLSAAIDQSLQNQ